jgi:RNA polymerase sigma-70 factor, ECF subfamily
VSFGLALSGANRVAAIVWRPPCGNERTRMNEPLSDKLLVERAARGDGIAFSELVNRHYRRALRVAFGLLRDTHDAEDVVQEAFARVHARLRDFEGASAFYTWLYRIVVNVSIDTLRRRRRERRVDIDSEQARGALEAGERLWPHYDETHPGDSAERHQLAERLSKAFATLPEIHQAVILLRELEGLSYEQIATTLQIKKGTVMSRLFHARRGMQQRLLAEAHDEKKAVPEGSA